MFWDLWKGIVLGVLYSGGFVCGLLLIAASAALIANLVHAAVTKRPLADPLFGNPNQFKRHMAQCMIFFAIILQCFFILDDTKYSDLAKTVSVFIVKFLPIFVAVIARSHVLHHPPSKDYE